MVRIYLLMANIFLSCTYMKPHKQNPTKYRWLQEIYWVVFVLYKNLTNLTCGPVIAITNLTVIDSITGESIWKHL